MIHMHLTEEQREDLHSQPDRGKSSSENADLFGYNATGALRDSYEWRFHASFERKDYPLQS
jgi:hypothetical protein